MGGRGEGVPRTVWDILGDTGIAPGSHADMLDYLKEKGCIRTDSGFVALRAQEKAREDTSARLSGQAGVSSSSAASASSASASAAASAGSRTVYTLPAEGDQERGREVVIETPNIGPRKQRAGTPVSRHN